MALLHRLPQTVPSVLLESGFARFLLFAWLLLSESPSVCAANKPASALLLFLQLVSGIKYIIKVEIGRTTCPKPAADLQSCALHEEPQMAKVGCRAQCACPWVSNPFSLTGLTQ